MADYALSIDALNAITGAYGGNGGHVLNIDALNQWAVFLGGEGGHQFNIHALNEIATRLGGEGGHVFNIAAYNEIATRLGGAAGHTLNIDALNVIADLAGVELPEVTLDGSTVAEHSPLGTVVGTFSDTAVLSNDAGGRFAISGLNLIVAGELDYETATSHTITLTNSQEFIITVTDVAETPPAEPLPDDGEIVDDGGFTNPPVVTVADGAVKISGKKAAGAGAFVYSIGAPEAGTTYTMLADPDWSLLGNQGKNALVGFGLIGATNGSAFEIAGTRGNGGTGLTAHTVQGSNFNNSNTHSLTSHGAAENGTVGAELLHQITISADGNTYTYRTGSGTNPASATWADEIANEPVASLPRFGVAAYFAAGDTGPFAIAIKLWTASPAATAGDVLLLSSSDELDPPSRFLLSGDAQSGTDALALSGA